MNTARKLGLNEFIRATDSVSLTEELRQGNFTVFAPVDAAFKDVGKMLPDLSQVMPKVGIIESNICGQIIFYVHHFHRFHRSVPIIR